MSREDDQNRLRKREWEDTLEIMDQAHKDRREAWRDIGTQDRRWAAIVVVCVFIILGCLTAAGAVIVNTQKDIAETQNLIEERQARLATCLLEQLTEHRVDSRYHNRKEAELGDYTYPDPEATGPVPMPQFDLEICREFLTPTPKEAS